MSPNEVTSWLSVAEKLGPIWGPLVFVTGLLIYAAAQRAKTPSEQSLPVTRADISDIMTKLESMSEHIADIKTELAVQKSESKGIEKRMDRMEAKA